MKSFRRVLSVLLSVLILSGAVSVQIFSVYAEVGSFPQGAEVLRGQSIHRLTPYNAEIRLHTDVYGSLYCAVTDTAEVPAFTDADAWSLVNSAEPDKVKMMTVPLNPGVQYIHWVVLGENGYSAVLTNEIPSDGYIFEDFNAFNYDMSTKNDPNYLPLYYSGSTYYGGQSNRITAGASGEAYDMGFRVFGANDSYTGHSTQRMNLPNDLGSAFTVEFDVIQGSASGTFSLNRGDSEFLSIGMNAPFRASSMSSAVTDYTSSDFENETQSGLHHIKVSVNMLTCTYDYFVDGVQANSKRLYTNGKNYPTIIQFFAANLKDGAVYDNIKVNVEGAPAIKGRGIYRDGGNADMYFWSNCSGSMYYTADSSSALPSPAEIKAAGTKLEGIVPGTNKVSLTDLASGSVYVNIVTENTAGILSETEQFEMPYSQYIFEDNESYCIGITPLAVIGKYNTGNVQNFSLEDSNRVFRAAGGYGTYPEYHSAEHIDLPAYTVEEGKTLLVLEADVTPIYGSPGPIFFGRSTAVADYVAGVNFNGDKIKSAGGSITHTSDVDKIMGETYSVRIVYDAYSKMYRYYINGQLQNEDPIDSGVDFDTDSINLYTGTMNACIEVDNLTFHIEEGSLHHHDYTDMPYFTDDAGRHYRNCNICGVPSSHDECVPDEVVTENIVEPTCGEDGSHDDVVYCSICRQELSRQAVTDPATRLHSFTVPVPVKEPTCTETGIRELRCSDCGKLKPETVYVHSRNLDDDGNGGNSYGNSLNTNEVITIPGAASLHVWLLYDMENSYDGIAFWEGNQPDYHASNTDQRALALRYFTGSGLEKAAQFDIAGDTLTVSAHSDSSDCNLYGYYAVITAENDGLWYTEDVPMLPHDYSEWKITEEPSCLEDGQKQLVCASCGREYLTEKAVHTPNIDDNGEGSPGYGDSVDYTAVLSLPGVSSLNLRIKYQTEYDYDYVYVWSGSHPEYTSANSADAVQVYTGDSWNFTELTFDDTDSVTIGLRSDSSQSYYYGFYAVAAGALPETVPALGHEYSPEWTVDTAPTCETAGSKSHHCTRCEDKTDITEIEPEGHRYSGGICTECGDWQNRDSEVGNLKAVNINGSIKLTWNALEGADSYTVYRKAGSETKWTKLGTAVSAGYTDKSVISGTKYTYTVCAENNGISSQYSKNGISVVYLATPAVKSVNGKGYVKVSWNRIAGADSYAVYKKTGSGKYVKITTVTGASKISYKDKSVKSGTKYTYYVKAVSGTSASGYKACAALKYLSAVKIKSVSNGKTGITVKWSKVSGSKGYDVYRKTGSGKYVKVASLKGASKVSYKDKSVKSGTKYSYYVKAKNGKYTGAYTASKALMYLSPAKIKSASSGKTGITVKWGKVSKAKGYEIYRKTGSGKYVKLAAVKGASKVSYLDKSAKKGKTYTYYVKAYNGKSKGYYANTKSCRDKY